MRHIKERPGLRYETCKDCGERWNISRLESVSPYGYLCPRCRAILRREVGR